MNTLDQKTDTDQWIALLTELGVPRTEFAPELEILSRSAQIAKHSSTFTANPAGLDRAASLIARDPSDYNTVVSHALEGAMAADEERRTAVARIFARAIDRINTEYVSKFRRRGSTLIPLLAPIYDTASQEAAKAWGRIPDGVRDLEQARKLNATEAWLALEKSHTTITNISALLGAWITAGILAPEAKKATTPTPVMAMYGDYAAAKQAQTRYTGIRRTGATATTGEPRLTDPGTLDVPALRALEHNLDTTGQAMHRQRLEDDREYREALATKPHSTRLHHRIPA